MASDSLAMLRRQLATAWALACHHLDGLTTDECLWRPAAAGPHVRRGDDGRWVADWPAHEGYDLGPPSIAWTSWHLIFWWSMALDRNFGRGTLAREDIGWPGDAAAVRATIGALHARWAEAIETADLAAPSRWPFADRRVADVVAWANVELTKNAAEIGYARFLYAVRAGAEPES
jgi:hypothetical protein